MKPLLALTLVLVVAVSAACSPDSTASAGVAARVNGVDITEAELDRQLASRIEGVEPPPSQEEVQDLKLQLLNELISNEILMQLAAADNLTATDAEVEVRLNEFKGQYSAERFQEILDTQRMTVEDLRDDLRTSLTIEKLVNKEITSKISVSNREIEEFFNQNRESFNLPESFRIAHILVTPTADADVANSLGDNAATVQEAMQKVNRLLQQVRGGQDFAMIARQYSEDPTSSREGGDLGFQPLDALAGLDPALADSVRQTREGEVFPRVIETRFGFHILKVLERDPGGQKDLSDPRVEAQIRQILFNRRDQLLKGAFFEMARNNSTIENFLARRILSGAGSS